MSDERPTRIAPRIETEGFAAPRLEPENLPVLVVPPTPRSGLGPVLGGVAVLLGGLLALDLATTIAALFDRALWMGWLATGLTAAGAALIVRGVARELRGLATLATVDRLRAALASGETERAKRAARDWAGRIETDAGLDAAIAAAPDAASVAALLRAGPGATLAARADALGRAAAVQAFAAAAASPSAALDAVIVVWRGLRLIREVASLYGVRPGAAGMLRLLRRTALSAASVAATDLATDALARAVLSSPVLRHVGGEVAGAGLAARRMILLARAAAAACSPVSDARPAAGA